MGKIKSARFHEIADAKQFNLIYAYEIHNIIIHPRHCRLTLVGKHSLRLKVRMWRV